MNRNVLLNVITVTASLWMYLVENVRVSGVEEVREPFFNSFDNFWPNRVHHEIITWHRVCFVTEEQEVEQCNSEDYRYNYTSAAQ